MANNSRAILIVSALALPPAVYWLFDGALLPFVLTTIGLASGAMAVALCRHGQFERAAFTQVCATLLIGLVLTLADRQVVDFGVALALLGPVQAALLGRSPAKKRSWVLFLVVVAIGALGSLGLVGWPEPNRPEYDMIAVLAFAIAALMVALSASRMNRAYDVQERGALANYRHLLESVQDAVMRFGPEGQVLFASKSAEKLFGCRRYELSGSGLIERVHVLDRPGYMKAFSDARHEHVGRTVEIRMRRDDADARVPQFTWVEITLTPVELASGPAVREIVAVLRDVSERHARDVEMREARRRAEDSSSAKSRFLATIGHELRTPLNAIVGFSEMMTSGVVGELSPAHKEYADIIHRSGHHLLDVVRMLLDMSRLEAGKFEVQTDSFEPSNLIEPCLKIVDAMARERHISVSTEIAKTLPNLIADERACRQILINLLSNAIKFSHEGGKVILSMRRQGTMLNISVTDQGIGMDSDAVGRIGEPFFQVQDGLARRYEGTGLGLSIVKGLADLHEGALRATSTPGEGTTVTVLLPLNGPATKTEETGEVTQLAPTGSTAPEATWPDQRKRA
ncbi:MAG: PAS domain-containing sensor histidine kinase [Devosia sp.]